MKQYAEAVAAQVKDPQRWPGTALLENFNDLQATVSTALEKGTLEGNLAGVLLMHQIAEEFLKALDLDCILYMQIKLYPFPFAPIRRPRRMFGQLLEDVESMIWFPSKKYILEDAAALNRIRIPMVHGLASPGALKTIAANIDRAKRSYGRFVWLALEAHLSFHSNFADFMDHEDWPPRDAQFYSEGGNPLE